MGVGGGWKYWDTLAIELLNERSDTEVPCSRFISMARCDLTISWVVRARSACYVEELSNHRVFVS